MSFWRPRTYLDWASASPVLWPARSSFWRTAFVFGNPLSAHEEGRRARIALEASREKIARLVECKPDDVIFTSGATEANNLAVRGLVRPGSHVLYLPSAHASVVESIRSLEGVFVEPVPIQEGQIDVPALIKLIRSTTVLICLDAVCGETGTIWNTLEVRNALEKLPKRPCLHVDASAAPFTQKLTRSHYGADLLVFDAQKVGGYRGVGILIAPRTIPLKPLLYGGGQERGLRAGTPTPALAAACAAALWHAARNRAAFVKRATVMKSKLALNLRSLKHIYINEGKDAAPNIMNISLPGRDTDYLVTMLDVAGIAVSTRSACETELPVGQAEGSRAVFALTGDRQRSLSTIRISWGPSTRAHELTRFATALRRALTFIDNADSKSHY